VIDYMPYDINAVLPEPVYEPIPGWKEDLTQVKSPEQLPEKLKAYISYLEEHIGVPVKYLSVGPDRVQTLILN
jgi:adenylosuccinate synthase